MDIKSLVQKLKKARTPKKFYEAANEVIEAATSFLDDNTYSSRDGGGIEVNVKIYSRLASFDDVFEKIASERNLSEDAKEYITEELGDDWANNQYEHWLGFERENIMLYLEDFSDVINEKEVGFAGRMGGHLILGDDKQYKDNIEEIENILYNYFDKEGDYEGEEKFSKFLDDEGDYLIGNAVSLEELDTYEKAIEHIKNIVNGIPDSWKDELEYRINEWYDDNFNQDDVDSYVERRDAHLKKKVEEKKDAEENPPYSKNKFIHIVTDNNEYYVNYLGFISQKKSINDPYYAFTGNWILNKIVRADEEIGEYIGIADFKSLTPERISQLNGILSKGDYHVADIDHNTNRIMGGRIISMSLVNDPRDASKMSSGGDVIQKDNSLFGIFMNKRFGYNEPMPEDSYYSTWANRWEKGIEKVWSEGDDTTRAALIDAIEEKGKAIHHFKDEELTFKDTSFPISYLFVKNRFGRDFEDSYAKGWIDRFNKPVEKTLGLMDTLSLGILVSILKFKQANN